MKAVQPHTQDEVQIVKQAQVKKTLGHVGTLIPESGHSLFEFNRETKILQKASLKDAALMITGSKKGTPGTITKRVNIKENCFYVSSLNIKNAVKKIHKQLGVAYVIAIHE